MTRSKKQGPDEEEWEYGDAWKEGPTGESETPEEIQYVEILRGDTGMGFDDTLMIDLITYLGASGIRATYDSISVGLEMGATKTYVFKVELGKEEQARRLLREKLK